MVEHLKHLNLINGIKERLKEDPVVKKSFDKHGVSVDEIDYIPVTFADLEVSARTDHGIVYLNRDLLETPERIDHYLVHEFTHYAQQTTGDGPTKGSTDDTYLDNAAEKEGFQTQTEYISETRGDDAAKQYVDKVLEHHEVPDKERKERREELLQLAQAAGVLTKTAAELSGTIDAWHCGKKFGQFSLDFLGHGENNHYLGPGIYFATSEMLARRYGRYHKEPWLYHVKIHHSETLYDPNRGLPLDLRAKSIQLQDDLAKEFSVSRNRLYPTDSFKYGKEFIGFLVQKLGRQKAISRLKEIGINGIYENLPNDLIEICVFDLSLIEIIESKRIDENGKDYIEPTETPKVPEAPEAPVESQDEERKERREELLQLASKDPTFKGQATTLRRLWKLDE